MMVPAIALFCLAVGLPSCVAGYKLPRVFFGFYGLAAGAAAGVWLGSLLPAGGGETVLVPLLSLSLAALAVLLPGAGAAVSGGGIGYLLLFMLLYTAGIPSPGAALAGFAAGAVLARLFFGRLTRAVTALGGALAAILALFVLLTPLRDPALLLSAPRMQRQAAGLLLVSIIMAAVAGCGFQRALRRLEGRRRAAGRI